MCSKREPSSFQTVDGNGHKVAVGDVFSSRFIRYLVSAGAV